MRWLGNGTKYCDQCSAGACQDCANEGEAREGLFEQKSRESGVENEAGLGEVSKEEAPSRTSAYRL